MAYVVEVISLANFGTPNHGGTSPRDVLNVVDQICMMPGYEIWDFQRGLAES
jgi:hypothetical protein